jgi:hypothetical protein
VTTGQTFGTMRVISKGLTPSDQVVVTGIALVVPGQKIVPEEQKLNAADANWK